MDRIVDQVNEPLGEGHRGNQGSVGPTSNRAVADGYALIMIVRDSPADLVDETIEVGDLEAQPFRIELGARHVVEDLAAAVQFLTGGDEI